MPQSREMLESEAIRLLQKLIDLYCERGDSYYHPLYKYRLGKLLLRRGNRTKNKITKQHAMRMLSINRAKLIHYWRNHEVL